jgi:hypothetical protein
MPYTCTNIRRLYFGLPPETAIAMAEFDTTHRPFKPGKTIDDKTFEFMIGERAIAETELGEVPIFFSLNGQSFMPVLAGSLAGIIGGLESSGLTIDIVPFLEALASYNLETELCLATIHFDCYPNLEEVRDLVEAANVRIWVDLNFCQIGSNPDANPELEDESELAEILRDLTELGIGYESPPPANIAIEIARYLEFGATEIVAIIRCPKLASATVTYNETLIALISPIDHDDEEGDVILFSIADLDFNSDRHWVAQPQKLEFVQEIFYHYGLWLFESLQK